jgi:hypothetical protein
MYRPVLLIYSVCTIRNFLNFLDRCHTVVFTVVPVDLIPLALEIVHCHCALLSVSLIDADGDTTFCSSVLHLMQRRNAYAWQ